MAVEVQAVSKRYGSLSALDQVSLQIRPGEFFSMLGPSGCGKTTLLRMIAGFENPSSGQILLDGQAVVGVPPYRRPVNMVFQNYALFPHLTIYENIAFGLRASKIAAQQIKENVEWALNLVRLQSMAERYPAQVSGGQAQRAALARAIVNQPRVLLLDEPLSALDLRIRQEMQEELRQLQRKLGITFVMVTHDQGEALALSDRIAVFRLGRLEQVGTPIEIYEQPASSFVADFVGQTNLIDGCVAQIAESGDFMRIQTASSFDVWARGSCKNPDVVPGFKVIVWMRTDSLRLSEKSAVEALPSGLEDHQFNHFSATVEGCYYQGATTNYKLKVTDSLYLTATCVNWSNSDFMPGDEVWVTIHANQVSILPV